MFCTRCGAKLDEAARFCSACGKPQGVAESWHPAFAANEANPPRKLRRIRSQKKIAGVCAGFAEYFDMDITWMRIIWVALLILPPSIGGIGYLVGWLAMPKE